MYLLHEKDLLISFHAKRQPPFLLIYRVIEERRWQRSKQYDNVNHSYQSEYETFSTIYIQNMVTFSTVISYYLFFSLKSFCLLSLLFATKIKCLNSITRLITIRSLHVHLLNRCSTFQIVHYNQFVSSLLLPKESEYDQVIAQSHIWHHEEEPQSINSTETSDKVDSLS